MSGEPVRRDVLSGATRRFEVWGDPIAHSLSPRLHTAAFAVQGAPAHYGRRRVSADEFAEAFDGAADLSGLSLTMPLKPLVAARADIRDRTTELIGAANTLTRTGAGWAAHNTDVGGIVRALDVLGIVDEQRVRIVGAGATATSAVVACDLRGVQAIDIVARRADAARAVQSLAESLGITAHVYAWGEDLPRAADVTFSTLPGGADIDAPVARSLVDGGGTLFDAVYGTWPTHLGAAFLGAGHPAHDGREMLLQQAVLQQRLFAGGSVDDPLSDEAAVVAAMRAAIVKD